MYKIYFLFLMVFSLSAVQARKVSSDEVSSVLEMLNKQNMEAQNECDIGYSHYGIQNYKDALYWFSRAAKKGYVEAQKRSGEMYATGIGVAQDYKEAIYWYAQAAKQGDMEAQKRLGEIYSELQNYKEALYWYTQAARLGDAEAQYNAALILDKGLGDVIQSHKEAIDWYELAAKQGHTEAQYNLGLKFLKGEGIKENKRKALHWLRRAAEKGHTEAQTYVAQLSDDKDLKLAESYHYGEGVEQSDGGVLRWYEIVAKKGYPNVQRRLINMYLEGKGIPVDKPRAAAWMRIVYESSGERGLDKSVLSSLSPDEKDKANEIYEQLVQSMNQNRSDGRSPNVPPIKE